jgi:hypothetical protein
MRTALYIIYLCLSIVPCYGQTKPAKKVDTVYLTPEQQKLIITPSRYQLHPQMDITFGSSRIYKADRSGIGFAVLGKLVYQAAGLINVNLGFGFTRLNNVRRQPFLTDTNHHASILTLPVGFSFVIGGGRSQIITTAEAMPFYCLELSPSVIAKRNIGLGANFEYGFSFRLRPKIYTGLFGRLQLFPSLDRNEVGGLKYGFAGAGLMVRYNL